MKTIKTVVNNLIPLDGASYREVIETKFKDILPALSLVDQARIEEDILDNGIIQPLIIWEVSADPKKYELVTGHLEYRMAIEHDLPFSVIVKKFDSEDAVIRFVITGTLNRLHLILFQKCELVLTYKEILASKGKENMKKGGKGLKILKEETVDTMVQLSAMVGCSHDTLRKVQYILKNLKNDYLLKQLRAGDITINKVHEELTGKEKTQTIVEENRTKTFPDFIYNDSNDIAPIELKTSIDDPLTSQFHIDERDKYQVVYIKPQWNLSNLVVLPDPFLEGLTKMNIMEIVHNQFCTLFIQTPSKYLADTMKIIESWRFICVDSICISDSGKIYSSNYTDQNHEILLICEYKGVGIPKSFIINPSNKSIIDSSEIMETLSMMFDPNASKVSIFCDDHEGWDTYDFDDESKMMLKFYNKAKQA